MFRFLQASIYRINPMVDKIPVYFVNSMMSIRSTTPIIVNLLKSPTVNAYFSISG